MPQLSDDFIILDDYEIESYSEFPERFRMLGEITPIGSGANSIVYKISGERDYALKVTKCEDDPNRFRNAFYEICVMKILANCDKAVHLLDSEIVENDSGKTVYILEEYYTPLTEYLMKKTMSGRQELELLMQLCDALIQCRDHGVMHLDIQPGNIFVDATEKIRLGDFHSALCLRDVSKNKSMRGTPAYMAPEVYRKGQCSERSEIYSVGMLLHYLLDTDLRRLDEVPADELTVYKRLAGAPLYDSLEEKDPWIDVKGAVTRICAYDPEDRPSSFEELKAILDRLHEKLGRVNMPFPGRVRPVWENEWIYTPRDLDVVFVVQSSGAMSGDPIQSINRMGQDILCILSQMQYTNPEVVIRTSLLSFGNGAAWIQKSERLEEDSAWPVLNARGVSCLGSALRELDEKLSRSELLSGPNRHFAPVIIFMMSGNAVDSYEPALEQLKQNPWYRAAQKIAFAVGDDVDKDVIVQITGSYETILQKEDMPHILNLLRLCSVNSSLSQSTSPCLQDYDGCAYSPGHYAGGADMAADFCDEWDDGWGGSAHPVQKRNDDWDHDAAKPAKPTSAQDPFGSDPSEPGCAQAINGFTWEEPSVAQCRVCGAELYDPSVYCPHCGSKLKIEKPSVDMQQVEFTAVAPKNFVKGEYSTVNIFMYEEAFRGVVDRLKASSDVPVHEEPGGTKKVAQNAVIRVRLTSVDVEIEDNDQEEIWNGGYLNFGFPVLLPENSKKRQLTFRAFVYIDGVIATRLNFTVKCKNLFEQKMDIIREDVLSAFISYASQDRKEVAAIVLGMKKVRPQMDIFFDVDSIRSGENWEKVLQKEIDKRDILYLCWSRNAAKSEWVEKEWRYAYEQKGEECIDPVAIEPTEICPLPPRELSKKHFNDRLAYFMLKLSKQPQEDPPVDIWDDSTW